MEESGSLHEDIGAFSSSPGFSGGTSGKEPAYQYRRPGFDPWVGKIPWRRAWQSTSVFLPGKSPRTQEPGGLQAWGHKESDMTEAT